MCVLKAYKFRLYPTDEQRQFFIETFGCVRFTYNMLLKQRHIEQPAGKLTPAKLKEDFPFLKKTDSLALANAQMNLERAFRNYYEGRAGYPKLKTKRSVWQSYRTNNQQHTIYFQEGKLKLPKLKTLIPVNIHRRVYGHIKSATISAKNGQEFYVSILCEEKIEPLPQTNQVIQLHFSPETLVESSELSFDVPIFLSENDRIRLKKAEKKLATRAKAAQKRKVHLSDAKNYQKQKHKVATLYTRYYDRKKAYLDELSIGIIRQYDVIHVTNLCQMEEKGLFSESDWLHFIQKIKYKSTWYGKTMLLSEGQSS